MDGYAVASIPGPFTQEQLLGGVVGIVLALLAVVLIYFGLRALRHAFSILTNEPIDVADVDGAEGVVELQGRVEVLEEPMAAKYSDEPAVAYSYKRQERRERRTDDGETEVDWETVDQGERAIPFQVADETGTVAVDPAGADISLNDERVKRGASRDTKQIEARLGPGDTVHVYGQAVEGAGPDGASVSVGDGEEDTAFSISDTTAVRAGLRYAVKGTGYTLVGIVIAVGLSAYFASYAGLL